MLSVLLSTLLFSPLLIDGAFAAASAGGLRVVGGEPAEEGRWPDAAAVNSGRQTICTGTLIAPTLALTAGHCAGSLTEVVLDTTDLREDGETLRIADTIAYSQWQNTYDVSLLILEEAATTTPRIIARDCIADRYLADGAEVAIVGYGATDKWGSRYGTTLMEATTTIVDADCDDPRLGCMPAVSPGGELVAGGDGIDSCSGDSGGPLYLLTSEGDFLVGVTSRATNTATTPCGDGGIYVRPDALIDWIEEMSGVELEAPSCDGSTDSGTIDTADTTDSGGGGSSSSGGLGGDGGPGGDDDDDHGMVSACGCAAADPMGGGLLMIALLGMVARRRA